MKQTEENGKTKSLFNNHGHLCFVHLLVKSQLTFLQVNRPMVLPPWQTALIHIRSFGVWGRKQNYGLECKTTFGRVLKPTIYIYTDMHILPSVYLCILLVMCFLLYILQLFLLI